MPVPIKELSPPDSPSCHSPSVMKVLLFCLKVGDERGTAVRDLVCLTDLIRVATVLEKELKMFLADWIRERVEEIVYVEQGSVPVFISERKV